MRRSSYLVRRGGQLYFRLRVPEDVRPFIARQELKRSLQTGDRRVARRRAATLAAKAFTLIAQIRTNDVLTDAQIQQLVQNFYEGLLDRDNAMREYPEDVPELGTELEAEYDGRAETGRELTRAAALGRATAEVRRHAEHDLAQALGHDTLADFPEADRMELEDLYRKLQKAYMRAAVEANARAAERDAGNWTGTPSDPLLQPPAPEPTAAPEPTRPGQPNATTSSPIDPASADAAPSEQSQLTPRRYVEAVIAEKTAGRPDRSGLAGKYRLTMRVFEEILGARPIRDYTERDIVTFKDQLLLMPTYTQTIPGSPTALEAIRWNEAQPPASRRQTKSAGTINESYLPYVRETFKHAADNGHVPTALGQRVRVSRTPGQRRGHDKASARYRFSETKLQKIFSQPLFLGATGPSRLFEPGNHLEWSWRFWLPLAMLYMGVRPQELGQLEITDVIYRHEYPCLSVTTISDADDLTGAQSSDLNAGKLVKSPAGRRELPIHPVLLDLGFMARVERVKKALRGNRTDRPEPRVFPEWQRSKTGRYAPAPSRFFNRDEMEPGTGRRVQGFLARAGVKTRTNVLYSLRHNYKQALVNCGFGDAEQDLLMGHSGSQVERIYGAPEAYGGLIEKVRHLSHEGPDLTALFAARGRSFEATPLPGRRGANVVSFSSGKSA